MPSYLTPAQVAAQLGIAPSTVRLWLKQGRFPGAIAPNVEWRIPEDALEQIIRPDPRGPKPKKKRAGE